MSFRGRIATMSSMRDVNLSEHGGRQGTNIDLKTKVEMLTRELNDAKRSVLPPRWGALESQWQQAFPCHRFEDMRLKTAPVPYRSTFLDLYEEADRKAPRPKPDPKIELRRLLRDDVSFEAARNELNDPSRRPTPQVTIEAVVLAVRERGLKALEEPDTLERLSRCDDAARTGSEVSVHCLVPKSLWRTAARTQ
jgi:hypothetical protein